MIKILIVEDSPVVREHLRHILEADANVRVIGMVANGLEAVRFMQQNNVKPDVITMDINMPTMNGHDATRRIMETEPVPIVLVTASFDKKDVEKSFLAMESGALAIVEKPFGMGHPGYEATAKDLIQTVKLMSEVKVVRRCPKTKTTAPVAAGTGPGQGNPSVDRRSGRKNACAVAAIGASTGGPPVIHTILYGIKPGFPMPILVVQHIARGFISGLTEWLAQTTKHQVVIASDGDEAASGRVYFAPDDLHMGIDAKRRIRLYKTAPENGIRPSVSHLFRSCVEVYGADAVGILLTGMGRDGADELKKMKDAGAITMVQDRESSVVYGMPGEALRLGAAVYVLTPENIAGALETLADRAEPRPVQ